MVGRISVLLAATLSISALAAAGEHIQYLPDGWWVNDNQFRDSAGDFWWHHPHNNRIWRWNGHTFENFRYTPAHKPKKPQTGYIYEDSKNRIWIFTHYFQHPQAIIFDPASSAFNVYPDLLRALRTELTSDPQLHFKLDGPCRIHIRDGKVGIVRYGWKKPRTVQYFDGTGWSSFTFEQISGNPDLRAMDIQIQPDGSVHLFNSETWIAEVINSGVQKRWIYNPDSASWKEVAQDCIPEPPPALPRLPAAMRSISHMQVKQDEQGDFWMLKDRHMYRHAYGKTIRFTDEPLELTTFGLTRTNWLQYVNIDSHGNRIVHINHPGTVFAMMTGISAPATEIQYEGTEWYLSTFHLTSSKPGCMFVWKLDDNDWSKPQKEPLLIFKGLMPGIHKLYVMALDRKLNREMSPASVEFTIEGDLETQDWQLTELLDHEDSVISQRAEEILKDRPCRIEIDYTGTEQFLSTFQLTVTKPESMLTWRLNQQSWSEPFNGRTIKIRGLTPGQYTLEVSEANADENMPAGSVSCVFTVPGTLDGHHEKLLALLKSENYEERNFAAIMLSRAGEETIRFLETALETADDDLAWWLKAVLQRMDDPSCED